MLWAMNKRVLACKQERFNHYTKIYESENTFDSETGAMKKYYIVTREYGDTLACLWVYQSKKDAYNCYKAF